jgi:hypothetical protein
MDNEPQDLAKEFACHIKDLASRKKAAFYESRQSFKNAVGLARTALEMAGDNADLICQLTLLSEEILNASQVVSQMSARILALTDENVQLKETIQQLKTKPF